jgi:hypothetical protein
VALLVRSNRPEAKQALEKLARSSEKNKTLVASLSRVEWKR